MSQGRDLARATVALDPRESFVMWLRDQRQAHGRPRAPRGLIARLYRNAERPARSEKLGRAMRAAEQDGEHPTGLAAIGFLMFTGFRRMEGLGLQRTWLNDDEARGVSQRCIHIDEALRLAADKVAAELSDLLEGRASAPRARGRRADPAERPLEAAGAES
jgi:hypothetical protein